MRRARSLLGRTAGCLGILFALGCNTAGAATRVEGLRTWQQDENTRLVFDLSAAATHTMSLADNPARVIIDLADTRLNTSLQTAELDGTPIQRIRSGMFTARTLRIVLDLHTPVVPEAFLLPPSGGHGNRLVVDVVAKGPLPVIARADASPSSVLTPAAHTRAEESLTAPQPVTPMTAPDATADDAPSSPVQAQPTTVSRAELSPAAKALLAPREEAPVNTGAEPPGTAAAAPLRIVAPPPARPVLIAIDAGHGGADPGALGPRRVREKDVVLAIARELEKRINQQPGYRATMVRKGDHFIPLKQRRDIARATGADLFVSIHADAFTHSRAHGGSVYALSSRGATSTSAAFLAQRENGADLIGGVELGEKDKVLAGVLTDLSMTATMDASLAVGSRVLGTMGRMTRLHSRRVEQAGFAVLKSPDMPSILVEAGFISNPAEAEKLASTSYQRAMAKAIFEGLGNYFLSTPPPGTQVAIAARSGAHPGEYVITHGDTLSGIAERYRVSVASLVKTNGLGDSGGIQAGQRILIPKS